MNDVRNLGTIHACATEAEAIATQARHGGTIHLDDHGTRPVWVVRPTYPDAA